MHPLTCRRDKTLRLLTNSAMKAEHGLSGCTAPALLPVQSGSRLISLCSSFVITYGQIFLGKSRQTMAEDVS